MMALKLTFPLAQEYGITQIQNLGDFLLVIQWNRKEATLKFFTLQPLFDYIQQHMTTFSCIYLYHMYRDMNRLVDGLSTEAFKLECGAWTISIFQDGHRVNLPLAPWIFLFF